MSRHAVVVVSVGREQQLDLSIPMMERYCTRYGLAFELAVERAFALEGPDPGYNYLTFEKFQAARYFERYERILRLDSDVLITAACPNVFEVVPPDRIGVVFEDVGRSRANRHAQMEDVCRELGDAPWNGRRYFNSGVVVASAAHRAALELTASDQAHIAACGLGGCKEQNFLNWKVRAAGIELFELDHRFNHLSMFSKGWRRLLGRRGSFILHYAGRQDRKLRRMQRDLSRVREQWKRVTE